MKTSNLLMVRLLPFLSKTKQELRFLIQVVNIASTKLLFTSSDPNMAA